MYHRLITASPLDLLIVIGSCVVTETKDKKAWLEVPIGSTAQARGNEVVEVRVEVEVQVEVQVEVEVADLFDEVLLS